MTQNALLEDNDKLLAIFENKDVLELKAWLENGGNPDGLIANPGGNGASLLQWVLMDVGEPEDDVPLVEMMELLIKHEANVNLIVNKDDYTVLHWAVTENRPIMAKLLLEAGADADSRTDEGMTPLLLAMENESWELFELLLNHASPKAINQWGNFHCHTPLGLAISEANIMAVELLLKHGADPHAYEPDEGNALNNLRYVEDASLREKIEMLIEKYHYLNTAD